MESQPRRLDKALDYLAKVEELAVRLSQCLEHTDFGQRRELLHVVMDGVIYNEGQVAIRIIIPLNNILPDRCQLFPLHQPG